MKLEEFKELLLESNEEGYVIFPINDEQVCKDLYYLNIRKSCVQSLFNAALEAKLEVYNNINMRKVIDEMSMLEHQCSEIINITFTNILGEEIYTWLRLNDIVYDVIMDLDVIRIFKSVHGHECNCIKCQIERSEK